MNTIILETYNVPNNTEKFKNWKTGFPISKLTAQIQE